MAAKKLTVVISQAQGKHPIKRQLEEDIVAALIVDPNVDVSLVPHVYDMSADHTGLLFLRSVPTDFVILAWGFPRATRWILDRQKITGHEGVSLLTDENEEDEDAEPAEAETSESKGIGTTNVINRKIYCIDLNVSADPQDYLDEISRIANEKQVQTVDLMDWIQGDPKKEQLERYMNPDRMLGMYQQNGNATSNGNGESNGNGVAEEPVKRRWYPVIDYSRCTNCMECIDFCLFGVYGVDHQDVILVEEQDSCKKGCPACSRVCPENAIIFPGHKTPAIAGADGEVGNLKIDLSQLFGAPTGLDAAVSERDAELVADGREAVGQAVGMPKRQDNRETTPRDDLDDLMDGLDSLDF
jgi:NAD-dependent dihydropyrimidine dehydrogenase PreA subunit